MRDKNKNEEISHILSTSLPDSLSPASLVVGRKTEVGDGHMSTQNLGGKKYVGR